MGGPVGGLRLLAVVKRTFLPVLLALPLLAVACSPGAASAAPLFELTNQEGQRVGLAQFTGKVVVLTFLYTHCAETCPTYVARIGQALDSLPNGKDKTAVIAVSVDPERDTVDRLREFSQELPANWQLLTGTWGQLKTTWDNYGVYVSKVEARQGHGGYQVVHDAKLVVIDPRGSMVTQLTGDWAPPELAGQVSLLLAGEVVSPPFRPWSAVVDFLYRCGPVTISTLGGAVGHFAFMLSFPAVAGAVLFLVWRRSG